MDTVDSFPGDKCEADHSPQSTAKIRRAVPPLVQVYDVVLKKLIVARKACIIYTFIFQHNSKVKR
jgi:hypothetical protein